MTLPILADPCFDHPVRTPIGGGRIRVVEMLATGTNGGAQEHVWSLLSRLDRTRYDVLVISLSDGRIAIGRLTLGPRTTARA